MSTAIHTYLTPVSTSVLEVCSLTIDTTISISITHSYCTSLVCIVVSVGDHCSVLRWCEYIFRMFSYNNIWNLQLGDCVHMYNLVIQSKYSCISVWDSTIAGALRTGTKMHWLAITIVNLHEYLVKWNLLDIKLHPPCIQRHHQKPRPLAFNYQDGVPLWPCTKQTTDYTPLKPPSKKAHNLATADREIQWKTSWPWARPHHILCYNSLKRHPFDYR